MNTHSHPSTGTLSMSVSEILAQAPLLLSTILSKQKNMGQPPLVPFLTTFRPLETGDIVIEVREDRVEIVIALLCFVLAYPTLPSPVLSCSSLSCPALSCSSLPCHAKHCTISTLLHPTPYSSPHSALHHTSLSCPLG